MSENHNDLVKGLIDKFDENGFEVICANYGEFKEPEEIQGVKPDVIAWDSENELYHLASVIEPEELTDEKTNRRVETLSNLMMSNGKSTRTRIPFYLGIPKQKSNQIEKFLDKNNAEQTNIFPLEV
ncbi:hypothetical protein C6988_01360 [Nitrosopumilus sp. b1]|uniref:hypothetical protein n=1 Tax=Nitrosopumilus sp. b1 TaxID=2109907 RepID=UPI0015F67B5D|nr:hypothetical protein [Nitrosopumilus sp. b1]KAF6243841.1 hypothetical protein C6988_01360 [Nitrosopumilus sp. b1]